MFHILNTRRGGSLYHSAIHNMNDTGCMKKRKKNDLIRSTGCLKNKCLGFYWLKTKRANLFGSPCRKRNFLMTPCTYYTVSMKLHLWWLFVIFIFLRQMGRQYYLGLGPAVVEVLSDDLHGISEYQKCICLGRSFLHCSVVL